MILLASDLRAWLENTGFGKYADTFENNDIGPDVLAQITESHLEQLGVSLGDRLRLLQAINGEIVRAIQTSAFVVADGMGARSLASETLAITAPSDPLPSSDAERRPLTVMFCDLADSTALSTRHDPEDLQDVIRAYQEVSTKRVREYEGYVAKYMGDGILVYFGYPKSLERNAERAVRSALSIVESMVALNQTMGREKGIEIAVRIGIATGMVMVGEVVEEGMAQERIVDDLKDKARNALHFVVFDACRNELRLTSNDGKSLSQPKGFVPMRETVRGMLIAYATAEGQIASDTGKSLGPYASELSRALVRPGLEAVSMFREVQINVFNKIGQEPWYTHGALRRVYLAGRSSSVSADEQAAKE